MAISRISRQNGHAKCWLFAAEENRIVDRIAQRYDGPAVNQGRSPLKEPHQESYDDRRSHRCESKLKDHHGVYHKELFAQRPICPPFCEPEHSRMRASRGFGYQCAAINARYIKCAKSVTSHDRVTPTESRGRNQISRRFLEWLLSRYAKSILVRCARAIHDSLPSSVKRWLLLDIRG